MVTKMQTILNMCVIATSKGNDASCEYMGHVNKFELRVHEGGYNKDVQAFIVYIYLNQEGAEYSLDKMINYLEGLCV